MEEDKGQILLYQTPDGESRIEVTLQGETVWLSLDQMAELFQRNKSTISRHIKNVFEEGELDKDMVVAKFATTTQHGAIEGKTQSHLVDFYNLDMIISVGYRVHSYRGVQFRMWATRVLKEYIVKGFALNDDLLKRAGGGNYFDELLARIRDIRSSEKVFYRKVLEIYALSIDYDPRVEMTQEFFKTVQNKMHFAVHEHTAAELIYERVDNEKPFVGMTNFKGNYVTRDDVKIAKNYLTELELQRLNLLTSQFLDYAEFQALEQNPMTMADWIAALDDQILRLRKNILEGAGTVSHQEAIEKAEREFEIYREREMRLLESDFDKAIKRLKENADDAISGDS